MNLEQALEILKKVSVIVPKWYIEYSKYFVFVFGDNPNDTMDFRVAINKDRKTVVNYSPLLIPINELKNAKLEKIGG